MAMSHIYIHIIIVGSVQGNCGCLVPMMLFRSMWKQQCQRLHYGTGFKTTQPTTWCHWAFSQYMAGLITVCLLLIESVPCGYHSYLLWIVRYPQKQDYNILLLGNETKDKGGSKGPRLQTAKPSQKEEKTRVKETKLAIHELKKQASWKILTRYNEHTWR